MTYYLRQVSCSLCLPITEYVPGISRRVAILHKQTEGIINYVEIGWILFSIINNRYF